MKKMIAVKRVTLAEKHLCPGRASHMLKDSKGVRPFPPFTALTITHYSGDQQHYLMYHCSDGSGTDTLHDSLEEALERAEWELGVKPDEWIDVNETF